MNLQTDLLKFIRSFSAFSDESWSLLRSIIDEVEFKKGEYLVHTDKICHSLFFISKGYCRAFNVQEGIEVNTSFFFEKDIATDMNSYVFGQKSSLAIQACEPVIAYRLEKNRILAISQMAPEIELIAKRNLQIIAAKQEKQIQLYRLLTATERYEYLEKNQPEILQRVSLTQLSSYLGVKRETLSRIRSKRHNK
jgi:CRP-like cAMP-binding protein